jgi:3',5'-cyclic AMP phosphodiesterase CpdA
LTVTKGDPMPHNHVSIPLVATHPILLPPAMTNQLLRNGQRTVIAHSYTDEIDDHDDRVHAETRALAGWRQLAHDLNEGLEYQMDTKHCFDGELRCGQPNAACKSVCLSESIVGAVNPVVAQVVSLAGKSLDSKPVGIVEGVTPPSPGGNCPGSYIALSQALDAPCLNNGARVRVCLSETLSVSRPLLSFVHLSDIQLRDGSVTLDDADLSRRLDWLIQSFQYDHDQQFYNPYLTEALFATINQEVSSYGPDNLQRPAFVMHTGDAIDSGVMAELRRFHQLVDRLKIPFYHVLGNHDTLVMGNLVPASAPNDDSTCASVSSVAGSNSLATFLPNNLCVSPVVSCPSGRCLGDEAVLVAKPTHAATRKHFIENLRDDPSTPEPAAGGAISLNHGFDFGPRAGDDALGYYRFSMPIQIDDKPHKAFFIALNSEDLVDGRGGIRGRIGKDQLAWLKGVLQEPTGRDLVFVFAHQPISLTEVESSTGETLDTVLGGNPHVIAYLYGHDHIHLICGDSRPQSCRHFWEIETGSLLEFPQEGRMVRIKQVSATMGFLDVFVFRESLAGQDQEFAALVTLARRGAERDYCKTHDISCSPDLRPYRTDGRETQGRLFFRIPGGAN